MHVSTSDPFSTGETEARADRYGVSGIPQVNTDGKFEDVGAGTCVSAANTYRNRFNTRMTETGGISPLSVEGYWTYDANVGSFQVNVEQLDPGSFGSGYQVTMFLIENNLTYCCGPGGINHWDHIARVVRSQAISLSGVGGTATVIEEFPMDPGFNPANLRAEAVVEQIASPLTVIQAGTLTEVHDFSLSILRRVGSVPGLSGLATFSGSITNVSPSADVLDLAIEPFGSWPASFQVEGDPTYYTSRTVALGPGQSKQINIRVQTDGVKTIAGGDLEVGSSNTGRVQPASMRVWNGSHSILFVDDDNNSANEGPFESALTNLGYLFEDWNVAAGHGNNEPKAPDMYGFDAVVWQTAYHASTVLGPEDIAACIDYLDDGGSLFLDSMDFLSGQTNPNPFVNGYLGVASWTVNTKASTATGVGGDPISGGMLLPLTWPQQTANRVDNLTAGAGHVIFTSEIGPNNPAAVRHELANRSRTVFCTIPVNVMSPSDADPNNQETVIERTLNWLLEDNSAGLPDFDAALGSSQLLQASPNPFAPGTELSFAISARAARSAVSLRIVDAAGREVRRLSTSELDPGVHALVWDGADAAGRTAPAGLYFAELKSADGLSTLKLVRMR